MVYGSREPHTFAHLPPVPTPEWSGGALGLQIAMTPGPSTNSSRSPRVPEHESPIEAILLESLNLYALSEYDVPTPPAGDALQANSIERQCANFVVLPPAATFCVMRPAKKHRLAVP